MSNRVRDSHILYTIKLKNSTLLSFKCSLFFCTHNQYDPPVRYIKSLFVVSIITCTVSFTPSGLLMIRKKKIHSQKPPTNNKHIVLNQIFLPRRRDVTPPVPNPVRAKSRSVMYRRIFLCDYVVGLSKICARTRRGEWKSSRNDFRRITISRNGPLARGGRETKSKNEIQ